MNRNLKFAIAAAIASLGVTGQAHALTQSGIGTNSSLFLYVFEDRGLNTTATNSAVFDLGSMGGFDVTANQSWDFSANSAWTTYISSIANQANVHWGVAAALSTGGTGSYLYSTFSNLVAPAGGQLSSAIINLNKVIYAYGGAACTSCGFDAVMPNDAASGSWGNNDGLGTFTGVMTTGLGGSMDFYNYKSNGTKAATTLASYAFNGDADYFKLDGTGHLSYVAAPVPEADSYAMMLAGLGLVGYMVRRRKAA